MYSFSAFVFSWRMRLSKIKNHKIGVAASVLFVVAIIVFGPPIYQESWLDPFNTLMYLIENSIPMRLIS